MNTPDVGLHQQNAGTDRFASISRQQNPFAKYLYRYSWWTANSSPWTSAILLTRPSMEIGWNPSIRYGERLAEAGIDASLSGVGDRCDSTFAETIIGLRKTPIANVSPAEFERVSSAEPGSRHGRVTRKSLEIPERFTIRLEIYP